MVTRIAFLIATATVAQSSLLSPLLSAADFKKTVPAFIDKHCLECHGGKKTKADLDLKLFKDDTTILQEQKQWRSILHQLNTGEMPPKKHPAQPTPREIEGFNNAVNTALARAEAKMPLDPGRVTARRLNRTEYNNTIRDLLHVDFNPAENFPADDIGHGFDNIGDVLNVSPVHLERYLDAAESIADRALPSPLPKPPSRTTYSIFLEPSGYRSENGTRPVDNAGKELFVRHKIAVAGEYVFRVRAKATNSPPESPTQLKLFIGDREVLGVALTNAPGTSKWNEYEIKTDLPVGEHRFAARFANASTNQADRMLYINEFKVIGPSDTRTDFQKQVASIVGPRTDAEKSRKATEWFVTRAFRRPPTKPELDRYVQVLDRATQQAENNWDIGLRQLVKTVLCSPKFLFRVELDDRPTSRKPHPLDDFQLASRLSYFIWSSLPDDELLDLAARKKLSSQLEPQLRRMLKDPRSEALVQNFGLQWLQLERLHTFAPDSSLFPVFNENLRKSMLRETELFLSEIIREDRSVLELVDADFTYLNEPLAKLYGIADTAGNLEGNAKKYPDGQSIRGREFVRVSLPGRERGGLLTQASVLTVTSNPTRTSPVKRGKWVLEQILGTPPPPPPPGVLGLEAQKELKGTLRQRMEQHRTDPACASCHQNMDSVGFAFENFDAIGRFRKQDGEGTIDPSGTMPDGKGFSGPGELKAILKTKKELVARNVTEKLLTYGLGRGLEYYDERAINKILGELATKEYRFSALLGSIVKSDPFRLRRGRESARETEVAVESSKDSQKNNAEPSKP